MQAGRLNHRVRFERAIKTADGGGGNSVEWMAFATVWAGFRPQFGREQIEAGRLESSINGTITIRTSSTTREVTADDRAVFVAGAHAGTVCQIRSIIPMRREIEMTIESAVAT